SVERLRRAGAQQIDQLAMVGVAFRNRLKDRPLRHCARVKLPDEIGEGGQQDDDERNKGVRHQVAGVDESTPDPSVARALQFTGNLRRRKLSMTWENFSSSSQ